MLDKMTNLEYNLLNRIKEYDYEAVTPSLANEIYDKLNIPYDQRSDLVVLSIDELLELRVAETMSYFDKVPGFKDRLLADKKHH